MTKPIIVVKLCELLYIYYSSERIFKSLLDIKVFGGL